MLLEVKNLKKYFPVRRRFGSKKYVHAVDGILLAVGANETFGLVGESGCGKSTLARCILRITEPTEGEVYFDGANILNFSYNEMKHVRRNMQIVYQDPFSSLDPRMRIKDIISEPLVAHGVARGERARELTLELLQKVGLREEHLYAFPHELSGGQKQRVAIARAISLNPKFLVLDEPTSFLDVSVRASILNLLLQLQQDLGLSYLFISHDLRTIYHMSDTVAVMYAGRIVEMADAEEIFRNAKHPYARALISSIPIPDPEMKRERLTLKGEVPSLIDLPPGCRFCPRCPFSEAKCTDQDSPLIEVRERHFVACHYAE
jgi:oligopeptide transport system ATP-binding protein